MAVLSEMPTPVKAGLFVAGGGSIIGGGAMLATGTGSPWLIIGLALVLCALVLVLYAAVLIFRRRKRAESFRDEMGASTRRSGAASDPNKIAEIDLLRRRFLEGVETYRREGYELYEMPWFLIMGEPGSGKSFALRKSSIGFLPGLQNELQGGGGTLTMDWWFTKEAVLLDTAGRFSMEDDQSTERQTSELAELLRLLRKHRRNCPVNGMILVIPAESLLGDTADAIDQKAKKLANTIHRVQRELDVRFPIIVWVTKCDMVPGFRAYFDSITHPERQHQMLGWSNPAELDEPFRAEQVSQHMSGMIEDLRDRRWSLLEEEKTHAQARRIEAVDSLYSFPENFSRIMSSLERYLELIFVGSRKPPFLRGIYFNSAITEGKEIDKQLAEAMGESLEEFKGRNPEGVFRRDKAFFIRDSLAKKLFVEKNLVTRASKAMSSLRRRQWFMGGAVTIAVIAMVVWAWFAHERLSQDILSQTQHWQFLEKNLKSQENLKLVSASSDGGGKYIYRGSRELPEVEGLRLAESFLDYYTNLADFAPREIRVSRIFDLFPTTRVIGAAERQRAWRIAFKIGILQPIISSTGEKLKRLDLWEAAPEEDAVLALLRWEGALSKGEQFPPAFLRVPGQPGAGFLGNMIRFLIATNVPSGHEKKLEELILNALTKDAAIGSLDKLQVVKFEESLNSNPPSGPVSKALNTFLDSANDTQRGIVEQVAKFEDLLRVLDPLKGNETSLLQACGSDQDLPVGQAGYYQMLAGSYKIYLGSYQDAASQYTTIPGLGEDGQLAPVLRETIKSGQEKIAQPFGRLLNGVIRLREAMPDFPFYARVIEKIQERLNTSVTTLSNSLSILATKLEPFDQDYLLRKDGVSRMATRFGFYRRALALFKTSTPDWTDKRNTNPLAVVAAQTTSFTNALETNRPPPSARITFDEQFVDHLKPLAGRATAYHTDFLARNFAAYCGDYLRANLAFPYVTGRAGALPLVKMNEIDDTLRTLSSRAGMFGDNVPALGAVVANLRVYLDISAVLTLETNGTRTARSLEIEVPYHDVGKSGKPLTPAQVFAGNIYRRMRVQGGESVDAAIPDTNKRLKVPLDASSFLVECNKEGSGDWFPILASANGPWAALRILLERAKPNEEEPDTYNLIMKAPDGTFFVLKLRIRLPRALGQWPRVI